MNTYFSSDSHAFHKNICRGTTEWGKFEEGSNHQSTRDFDTSEAMTKEMASRWNSMIKQNDELWFLGDWSFGGHKNIEVFRKMINCKNIHIVFGNHDQHIEPVNSPYRQLFSSCQYYKELSFKLDSNKTKIVLSHYAMRVWNQHHHKSIHLYGHSHGTLPSFGRSMDVGVDTNNLYPYHLDEIIDKMKGIPVNFVDHHKSSTN